MTKVLTALFVASAKPGKTRTEYRDAALPGFVLRITPEGTKSFSYRYRSPADGKQKRLTWKYPAYTLAEARTEAENAVRAVGRKDDPRPAATPDMPETVGELCSKYVDQHLKKHVRKWKAAEGEIENHIRPKLGTTRLEKVTKGHVRQLVTGIESTYPVAANRVLARLRAIFNWGMEEDICTVDPTRGVKKPTKEKPTARILTDDELRDVWLGCEALEFPAREYMRSLILSGQRRDDVRCVPWPEIDRKMMNWVISADRYKSGRPHLIPLTPTLLKLFDASSTRKGYVFSLTEGKKAYGNLVKPKKALDKASGVTGWTLHDIRRTVRTGLSRLGFRPDIAERVIGHSVGGKLGETYDVYSYREEKLQALQAWETHVFSLLTVPQTLDRAA